MPADPPGIWCPFATHKPIPAAFMQRAIPTRAFIVHSAGGHSELYNWWLSDQSHGLESTFFICDDQTGHGFLDGEIVQYIGVGIKADANGEANAFATSCETASSVSASEPWTPAQAASLIRLIDWHATVTPTARKLMSTPTDTGIAWHVQFGAPGPWTPSRGKVCPGPARVAQLQADIIPAVIERGMHPSSPPPPTPLPEGPLMALTDAEQTELLTKVRELHSQWIGTKSDAKPETLRQIIKETRVTVGDIASGARPKK